VSVRMSGAMPIGERNGLASLAHLLVEEPGAVRVAVVLVDAVKLTTDVSSGDTVPTVRIRAIEPISAHETDAAELHRLMRRAYERRTGQTELPLELERELESLNLEEGTPDEPADDDKKSDDDDKKSW
jgi:hypothetical protein